MNAAPPKIAAPPASLFWFGGAVLTVSALGVAATVYFFNPATHPFYPVCLFHELTGLNCPSCGATRALYAGLHGRFAAALHDNALFVLAPLFLALRKLWLSAEKFRGRPRKPFFPATFLWPALAAMLVFGILRNLPAFSFLSP
jgi:hypothetical protein